MPCSFLISNTIFPIQKLKLKKKKTKSNSLWTYKYYEWHPEGSRIGGREKFQHWKLELLGCQVPYLPPWQMLLGLRNLRYMLLPCVSEHRSRAVNTLSGSYKVQCSDYSDRHLHMTSWEGESAEECVYPHACGGTGEEVSQRRGLLSEAIIAVPKSDLAQQWVPNLASLRVERTVKMAPFQGLL